MPYREISGMMLNFRPDSGFKLLKSMHAVKYITPEVLLVMCLGGIAFILILKAIFKRRK